jgi:hypothetical protein
MFWNEKNLSKEKEIVSKMFLKNCLFFTFVSFVVQIFSWGKMIWKKASYKKINQNNGKESTVNRALDGNIYPG